MDMRSSLVAHFHIQLPLYSVCGMLCVCIYLFFLLIFFIAIFDDRNVKMILQKCGVCPQFFKDTIKW